MSSDPNVHSAPIPISTTRPRGESISESSETGSSPLLSESPSHSPSSSSAGLPTPLSSSYRGPLSPVSPTSPIMSYLYGSPGKNPFQIAVTDDAEAQEGKPIHHRRMSTWVPIKFNHQNTKPVADIQQQRGAGILRRLSLSTPKPTLPAKPDAKPGTDTAPLGPPSPRTPRKAATISAGSANKPRAPSPMGERILKGHYDGF